MKKIGALSFATFYLMITTGMFVCLLHCSMGSMLTLGSQEVHVEAKSAPMQAAVVSEADCACCEHHGEYAVKENVKTAATTGLKARYVLSAASQNAFSYLIRSLSVESTGDWTDHNSAPAFKKTPIYLSNRVLII
ncbi:hypothetical protein [Pedobacter gandavensis]|uniref:Uncharacterized protein n=1 Tax=Pedobacter gandavensis TaxID=2679963 RepID=A0ABR6F0S0_9SPHI|nr:hypothetical protein [Pedobacter gandavensis]MBB2150629.1 hypothetical protein [Pedobacter gandavensis]